MHLHFHWWGSDSNYLSLCLKMSLFHPYSWKTFLLGRDSRLTLSLTAHWRYRSIVCQFHCCYEISLSPPSFSVGNLSSDNLFFSFPFVFSNFTRMCLGGEFVFILLEVIWLESVGWCFYDRSWDKLLDFSLLQFPHLEKGDKSSAYLLRSYMKWHVEGA